MLSEQRFDAALYKSEGWVYCFNAVLQSVTYLSEAAGSFKTGQVSTFKI
jgi:hypothetical protein